MKQEKKRGLFATTLLAGLAIGAPAFAQSTTAPAPAASAEDEDVVVVTGSRLARRDYVAESPISTVSQDALVGNADVTLETFLNTLPQVIPGGTTTSNNPPNGGQANIDLRGLGQNRNLVLIDGRRPMVSANDLTVDVNTIPAALIEQVEVITGGAGAVYGADAIAGVVNIRLRNDFEGVDLRTSYQNSTEFWDAEEFSGSLVIGGNFADDRGNAVFAFDHTTRESLVKGQREFSKNATSTTGNPPDGVLRWNSPGANGNGQNPVPQAAVNALFATAPYGSNPAGAAPATSGRLGFNANGTLFAVGASNNSQDVVNYRGPIGNANPRYFPDFYSYNFDPINLLQLPLDRDSFMTDVNYRIGDQTEVFIQAGWTQYNAATALAPSPVPGVTFTSVDQADPASEVGSTLITPGKVCNGSNPMNPVRCEFSGGIPVNPNNSLIPADLKTLLNARTGDDLRLVGSGAGEAFLVSFRPVDAGLRQETFTNTVVSYLAGARGPIGNSGWDWEAYISEGTTKIVDRQAGNIDTQAVTDLLGLADGGQSLCAGGFNVFGPNRISQACLNLVKVTTQTQLDMQQQVGQVFIKGTAFELPAGDLQVVLGGEYRAFEYNFDPGSLAGPISGFGSSDPEKGSNEFLDAFTEVAVPVTETFDLSFGARVSRSQFVNLLTGIESEEEISNSYKAAGTWAVADPLLLRGSVQRAVRAPNFSELFAGGTSFPQIFNPCSTNTAARTGANGAQVLALCNAINGAAISSTFQETPGGQALVIIDGNPNLKPETADTYTIGLTFDSPVTGAFSYLRGSVDYYRIKIKDAILAADPNVLIADCFNYLGTNTTYNVARASCSGLAMGSGSFANQQFADPSTANGSFQGANTGSIDTSGVDFTLDAALDLPGTWGSLKFNSSLTYLLEYLLKDTPGAPEIDYAGSVNYFGGGISLGQTLPEIRGTFVTTWDVSDLSFQTRGRYIGSMDNRASRQYTSERTFTGTDAVWYWDVSAQYSFGDHLVFRLGVNNVADEQPQTYAPNVQSGTDPSTYDIIGRRVFAAVNVRY